MFKRIRDTSTLMHENTYNISMTKHQIRLLKALNFSGIVEQNFAEQSTEVLMPREERNKARELFSQKNYNAVDKICGKYLHMLNYLPKFVPITHKGRTYSIPVIINKKQQGTGFMYCNTRFINGKNLGSYAIYINPISVSLPTASIDCSLAHEIAHAHRFLRETDTYYTPDEHLEFWTDRELKKYLPLIDPKYQSKAERRNALRIDHQSIIRDGITGQWTKLGQLWDRIAAY